MTSPVHWTLGCGLLLAATLLAGPAAFAGGVLQSEDGAFGPGTITFDTVSGERWLDLTESTGYSLTQVRAELAPGGIFEGYRLATIDEVRQLFEHAGLDLAASDFVPQNYAPSAALGDLVGVLADNGSCGTGCSFFFTNGYYDAPPPEAGWALTVGIAWFDNSSGVAASYPLAPIGRWSAGGTLDESRPDRGSWLVLPEPGALATGAAAIGALALARWRRAVGRPSIATRTGA